MSAKTHHNMPNYTQGEERFNMISHIVGGGLGVVALLVCVIIAAYNQNIWGIISGLVYGFSAILLFTMSSIYHGLNFGLPKRVFRILDHCTISVLIAGTSFLPAFIIAILDLSSGPARTPSGGSCGVFSNKSDDIMYIHLLSGLFFLGSV